MRVSHRRGSQGDSERGGTLPSTTSASASPRSRPPITRRFSAVDAARPRQVQTPTEAEADEEGKLPEVPKGQVGDESEKGEQYGEGTQAEVKLDESEEERRFSTIKDMY